MNLKKRFIFLPLLVIIFSYLIYSIYKEVRIKTINDFNAQQLLLAKQAAKSIEALFEMYFNELTYLSGNTHIVNLDKEGKDLIQSYYKYNKNKLRAITRVNESGEILYTIPYNKDAIGTDISYQDHMTIILKTYQPVISDVFYAVQNYKAIAYHVPIVKNEKFYGTLAVLIPFDNIVKEYLENIKTGEGGYAWIISQKGIELFCPEPGHVGNSVYENSKNNPDIIEIATKMLSGLEGTSTYSYNMEGKKSFKSLKMHAVFYPIRLANTFWSICVAAPESVVLATMKGFRDKFFLIVLLLMVVGVIYTYYFIKAWIVIKEERKRKKAEEALQQSEERFRELADLLPQIVFETNEKGDLVFANIKAFEYFGYTQDEFEKGLNCLDMLIPSDRERAQRNIEKIMIGDNVEEYEYTAMRKNGETFPALIYSDQILKDQQPAGLRGIIVDISDYKQAVEALCESEEQFRSYIDNAPDGIFVFNEKGEFIELNNAASNITGYSKEKLIKKKFGELISLDDQTKFSEFLGRLCDNGKSMEDLSFIKKDGTPGQWTIDAVKLGDSRFLGFVKDITERKSLEAQFQQSQKMEAIGHLAGGVAHDFNNLLTVINGYSEMLLGKLSKNDENFDSVHQILKAGQRAGSLTRQLLAFSRKQILQPIVLDLNQTLLEMEKMFRRLIGEDIDLITIYAPNLCRIKTDPGQLEQVILNLIVNSRDAMPAGGKLIIETDNVFLDQEYAKQHRDAEVGMYVMLSITDTGVGMSQEVMNKIFDPFFTTKPEGKGTGLGLSTVFGIVKQSGGNISVSSEPNQGTTFKIYLKALDEEVQKVSENLTVDDKLTGKETILLVEDEDAVRELASVALNSYGYNVIEASNADEAIKLIQEKREPFDLLLTDVVMPGKSGKIVVDNISKLYPDIRIMYMSGYTDDTIVQHGVLNENTNFIQKPFSPFSLVRKIREVLDNSK